MSKSVTKEPVVRSDRRRNRGIMRFLIGAVSLGPSFVSDLDIVAAFTSFGRVMSAAGRDAPAVSGAGTRVGSVCVAGRGRYEKRGAACAVPLGVPWLRGLPWPRSLVFSVPLLGWVRVLRCLWCVVRIRWSSSELVGIVYAQRASRRLMPV